MLRGSEMGFIQPRGLEGKWLGPLRLAIKRHLTVYLSGQYELRRLPPRHDRLTPLRPLARVNLPSFLVTPTHKFDYREGQAALASMLSLPVLWVC